MSRHERRFKNGKLISVLLLTAAFGLPQEASFAALNVNKQETGLYRDVFEQNIYYEGTSYLRLDRLYRALFRKKVRSKNVNVFDQVPDSAFFTNRHARNPLSSQALHKGYSVTDGPSTAGPLVVTKGKFEGLHPGFFVRDERGDAYLLKFDPFDYFELTTSAEIIASRFYHAIGYNVPQYTIASVSPERLQPGDGAKIVDDSGFKKLLTEDKLMEYTLFLPRDENGNFRASASKIIEGENKGYFAFQGTREGDPTDQVNHKDRREVRALRVFSSWLNNVDLRESNTFDVLISKDGKEYLKHYLIDFNSALGASAKGPKPPMLAHEHMMDYGEGFKAFLSLGFWKKPWQKRWEENGKDLSNDSPAVGYFDNKYFDPEGFKTQFPHYAFKDLTRADGFWAAKIIHSFSDEDIRAMVDAGQLSRPDDADYLVRMLSERRDIISSYWFAKANPLDDFAFSNGVLSFKDLSVEAGFVPAEGNVYHFDVVAKRGNRGEKLASMETSAPRFQINSEWFSSAESLNILIRTARPGNSQLSPYVLVELSPSGVTGIMHED